MSTSAHYQVTKIVICVCLILTSLMTSVRPQTCGRNLPVNISTVERLLMAPIVVYGKDVTEPCELCPPRRRILLRVSCVLQSDMGEIPANMSVGFPLTNSRSCAHTMVSPERHNNTMFLMVVRDEEDPTLFDWYETDAFLPSYLLPTSHNVDAAREAFSLNDWSPEGTLPCPSLQPEPGCPSGWVRIVDRCVRFNDRKLGYEEAKQDCMQQESHLLSVEDGEYMQELLRYTGSSFLWTAGFCQNASCRWIVPQTDPYMFSINYQALRDNNTGPVIFSNSWHIESSLGSKHQYACQKAVDAQFGLYFRTSTTNLGYFCCKNQVMRATETNLYKTLKTIEGPSYKFRQKPSFYIFPPTGAQGGVYTILLTSYQLLRDQNSDHVNGLLLSWIISNAVSAGNSEGDTVREYLPLHPGIDEDLINGRGNLFTFRLYLQKRRLLKKHFDDYFASMEPTTGCAASGRCITSLSNFTSALDLVQLDRKHIRAIYDDYSIYHRIFTDKQDPLVTCRTHYPNVSSFQGHLVCPPPPKPSTAICVDVLMLPWLIVLLSLGIIQIE